MKADEVERTEVGAEREKQSAGRTPRSDGSETQASQIDAFPLKTKKDRQVSSRDAAARSAGHDGGLMD